MPQFQVDTDQVATEIVSRIRTAAKQRVDEAKLVKTASDNSRRARVVLELQAIDKELDLYGDDRNEIEEKVGAALSVPKQFGKIVKEASIQALGSLGGKWGDFRSSLGL